MLGLITIAGVFSFFVLQRRHVAAGVAVLLIATLPTFITFARSSMSETSGAFVILCAFGLVFLGQERNDFRFFVVAGACLGFATTLRIQLVMFAPLLSCVFFLEDGARPLARVRQSMIIGLAFIAGIAPTLWANWASTGNPLTSGYAFWLPTRTLNADFGLEYVAPKLRSVWNELTLQPNRFTSANIFGTGAFLTPPFIVLSAIASTLYLFRADRKRAIRVAATIPFAFGTTTYYFDSLRLYHPFWLLMVFPIAHLCEELNASRDRAQASRFRRGLIAAAVVAVLVGVPSSAGYPPGLVFSQTMSLSEKTYLGARSPNYEALMALKELGLGGPVLVVTEISPVFGSSILDPTYRVIPGNNDHDFQFSHDWMFGDTERELAIFQAFERGERVVLLSPRPSVDRRGVQERLGLSWAHRLVDLKVTDRAMVLEVTPLQDPEMAKTSKATQEAIAGNCGQHARIRCSEIHGGLLDWM